MQSLPNIWLDSLVTFDSAVEQIEAFLTILKSNAVDADFTDGITRNRYATDVLYMKQFFERAEKLAREGQ
ncbi:hypothetical protein UFOVP116_5 [uncultured Caudovirales phage]|uniref:Uncharacterized protein n=1 Tax=uncultured Caudovirales phage TaxID=2100421 RepID=A0A6J5L9E6_9CAUD|nr:hypothetical protein UFOVP116_5 [uncultured Caudovirales phage]